jgi:hypothetical protein
LTFSVHPQLFLYSDYHSRYILSLLSILQTYLLHHHHLCIFIIMPHQCNCNDMALYNNIPSSRSPSSHCCSYLTVAPWHQKNRGLPVKAYSSPLSSYAQRSWERITSFRPFRRLPALEEHLP